MSASEDTLTVDAMYGADKLGFADRVAQVGGSKKFAALHGIGQTHVLKLMFASAEMNKEFKAQAVQGGMDARNKILASENKRLREFYSRLEDALERHARPFDNVPPKYHLPTTAADEELAMCLISDTQIGMRTESWRTGGLGEYSWEIFKERAEVYKHGIDSIINGVVRKAIPVRRAVVMLNGDMADGENIFPGQAFHNDLEAELQIFDGADVIAGVLRHICGMFEEVICYCTPGNHGRVKDMTLNLDRVIYEVIRMRLADQKNLRIVIAPSHYLIWYVSPELGLLNHPRPDWPCHNFLVSHGSNIRSYNRIPAYGLDRATRRYQDAARVIIDQAFFAHFHERAMGYKWMLNGAWPGASDYSVEVMQGAARPEQLLQLLHPWQGITSTWWIRLAGEPALQKDGAGLWTETRDRDAS